MKLVLGFLTLVLTFNAQAEFATPCEWADWYKEIVDYKATPFTQKNVLANSGKKSVFINLHGKMLYKLQNSEVFWSFENHGKQEWILLREPSDVVNPPSPPVKVLYLSPREIYKLTTDNKARTALKSVFNKCGP